MIVARIVALCISTAAADAVVDGLRTGPEPNAEAMVEALNSVKDYLNLEDDAVHDNLQPAFEKIEQTVTEMEFDDPGVFTDLGGILEGLLSGSDDAQEDFEDLVPRLNAAGEWMRGQDPQVLVEAFKEAAGGL